MRPLVVSTVCLFLLPLGCNSSANDPEAAAKAAKSAAGGLEPLGPEPEQDGPVILDPDAKHPRPGRPGDFKPPPSVGTATCIVDDGDDAAEGPNGTDIKGPGKFTPKVPKLPDRTTPEAEGATPRSARHGAREKTGAVAKSGLTKDEQTRALAKSSDGDGTAVSSKTTVINWSATCASQMTEDTCKDVCGERGWDESAGNGGTCFVRSAGTAAADGSRTSVECGCMCLPGS